MAESVVWIAGVGGFTGRQWVFVITGIAPVLVGLFAWYWLDDKPASPTPRQCAAKMKAATFAAVARRWAWCMRAATMRLWPWRWALPRWIPARQ